MKNASSYLKSGFWGGVIGAVATAIPFGVGKIAAVVAGTAASAGAAGVLGGVAALYAAYVVGTTLLVGLGITAVLRKNLDGFSGIKFRTLLPGMVLGGALVAGAFINHKKEPVQPATKLPAVSVVTQPFNGAVSGQSSAVQAKTFVYKPAAPKLAA